MPARLAAVLVLAAVLAGCSSPEPATTTSPPPASPSPSATATSSALDLDTFDAAVEPLTDNDALPKGSKIIAALVDVGYDKSDMELTADKTAIGLDADSIEFSVKVDDQCLIGQFGSFGYRSVVMGVLATDTCLVGETKPVG